MYKKRFIKDKGEMLLAAPDYAPTVEARPKKGDKIRKHNIQHCDGAQYMSCFKVSSCFNWCKNINCRIILSRCLLS